MNRVYINGADVSDDITEGLEDITLELGLNTSTKTIGKVLSTDMTATGSTYEYLRDLFFKKCGDWTNTATGLFQTSICGGIEVETKITSEGVEWCPEDEEIRFNLKSEDEISRAYARLDSEYITENGFRDTNDTPIMYYASQPNWIQWTLLLATIQIRFILNLIDTTINTLCEAVTLGFGKCKLNLSATLFRTFDTWITGLGRWTVAPLVREILVHQCNAVGLTFSSSIFEPTSSRYNLAYLCLEGGEHGDYKDTSRVRRLEVFEANAPAKTTIELLTELGQVFNADFRIIGSTLHFERVDYFDDIRTKKLLNTEDFCLDDPICISHYTKDACAYGEYSYTNDAFDLAGNGTMRLHYADRYTFNEDPYNPAQKGKCARSFAFGPARFMFDEKLRQTKGFFNYELVLDGFRRDPEGLGFFIENFFTLDGIHRNNDLILTGNMLAYPKLLVLENNFDRLDAKVIKRKTATTPNGKGQYFVYNEPMHVEQLFNDFLFLDNPRINNRRYEIADFTIECDCEVIKDVIKNFHNLYIENPHTKIIPEKIAVQITDNKASVTFSGLIGLCN